MQLKIKHHECNGCLLENQKKLPPQNYSQIFKMKEAPATKVTTGLSVREIT
jgi:hypothetical protein